jgi:hypothetical protein
VLEEAPPDAHPSLHCCPLPACNYPARTYLYGLGSEQQSGDKHPSAGHGLRHLIHVQGQGGNVREAGLWHISAMGASSAKQLNRCCPLPASMYTQWVLLQAGCTAVLTHTGQQPWGSETVHKVMYWYCACGSPLPHFQMSSEFRSASWAQASCRRFTSSPAFSRASLMMQAR